MNAIAFGDGTDHICSIAVFLPAGHIDAFTNLLYPCGCFRCSSGRTRAGSLSIFHPQFLEQRLELLPTGLPVRRDEAAREHLFLAFERPGRSVFPEESEPSHCHQWWELQLLFPTPPLRN